MLSLLCVFFMNSEIAHLQRVSPARHDKSLESGRDFCRESGLGETAEGILLALLRFLVGELRAFPSHQRVVEQQGGLFLYLRRSAKS